MSRVQWDRVGVESSVPYLTSILGERSYRLQRVTGHQPRELLLWWLRCQVFDILRELDPCSIPTVVCPRHQLVWFGVVIGPAVYAP